jgi:hypothetical protein
MADERSIIAAHERVNREFAVGNPCAAWVLPRQRARRRL